MNLRDQADKRPDDQGAGFAHPVGHDLQESRTARTGKVGQVSRTENHNHVENPTEHPSADDSHKDRHRSGDRSLLDFLADVRRGIIISHLSCFIEENRR